MASFGTLLRYARAVVRMVSSQLRNQFNVVENDALSPLRGMIGKVSGGVWVGEGANAFVEEVSSITIPGVGRVMDEIDIYDRDLLRAAEIMEQADQQVRGIANHLGDVFNFY